MDREKLKNRRRKKNLSQRKSNGKLKLFSVAESGVDSKTVETIN